MSLKVSLKDPEGNKSVLTIEGAEQDAMLKQLDGAKKMLLKHHLTITDYKFYNSEGLVGEMSHSGDCLNCGKKATTVFTKDEKTRGIISASVRITLCHNDFMRYTKPEEGKFRSDMWSLGLTKHLLGGE